MQAERSGMVVCGRSGRWTFGIRRLRPGSHSALDLIGHRDSEADAADLICEHDDNMGDRDASLAVEEAAVQGTARIGEFFITLEPR